MKIMVTGSAGFIGSNMSLFLLEQGHEVIGLSLVSCMKDFHRVVELESHKNYTQISEDINDSTEEIFKGVDYVIHLAADSVLRGSFEKSTSLLTTNILGFDNIIKQSIKSGVKKIVYASSSSIYPSDSEYSSEDMRTDDQLNIYSSSKKCNESIASCYNNSFDIELVGARFFTVYGPRGREDMLINKTIRYAIEGKTILINGDGSTKRDYIFVDDLVRGIYTLLKVNSGAYVNIGTGVASSIDDVIDTVELVTGKKIAREYVESDKCENSINCCNPSYFSSLGFTSEISLKEGIRKTLKWMETH